jgi:hypothetical protein
VVLSQVESFWSEENTPNESHSSHCLRKSGSDLRSRGGPRHRRLIAFDYDPSRGGAVPMRLLAKGHQRGSLRFPPALEHHARRRGHLNNSHRLAIGGAATQPWFSLALANAYTRAWIAHFILKSVVQRHDDLYFRTLQSAGQKPEFAAEPLRPPGHRPNTETP